MHDIYTEFRYLDDPEQHFPHARFPALPRIGDFVVTPPPRERRYRVVAVGFHCEGSRPDETAVVVELRVEPPEPPQLP